MDKRSGIIQGLFLPPFLQEFCGGWRLVARKPRSRRGTGRGCWGQRSPLWSGGAGGSTARGEDRVPIGPVLPAASLHAGSLSTGFSQKTKPSRQAQQALMTNDRWALSLSPPRCHPFTFAPGPLPTTIINSKSGVSLLCWTQPWKFLACCSSFLGWKPSAGDTGEKGLITPAAGWESSPSSPACSGLDPGPSSDPGTMTGHLGAHPVIPDGESVAAPHQACPSPKVCTCGHAGSLQPGAVWWTLEFWCWGPALGLEICKEWGSATGWWASLTFPLRLTELGDIWAS